MFYPTNPSEMYGLFALRLGKYKAHFYTQGTDGPICTFIEIKIKYNHNLGVSDSSLSVCPSGSSHSSTTPDQNCSVFASLKFHDPPLTFDLEADPSEHYPLSLEDEPELQSLLQRIKKVKEQFEASMVFGDSQMLKGSDPSLEPCCTPQCNPKPNCCQC